MSNIVAKKQSSIVSTVSSRTSRALARVEERALLRAAEIQGIAYVGHAALRAIAEISMVVYLLVIGVKTPNPKEGRS